LGKNGEEKIKERECCIRGRPMGGGDWSAIQQIRKQRTLKQAKGVGDGGSHARSHRVKTVNTQSRE